MKKIIKYKCDYCSNIFNSEKNCKEHEDRHIRIARANQMLSDGKTLKEIQDKYNIWNSLPDYLNNVTQRNCFMIPHWQCCDNPAYTIIHIRLDGYVKLYGCGSQSGYYSDYIPINSSDLMNPRPEKELFIDKRYLIKKIYGVN